MNEKAYIDLRIDMMKLFLEQFGEVKFRYKEFPSFYIPSLNVLVGYANSSKAEHFTTYIAHHPKYLGIAIGENISAVLSDSNTSNYNQHKEKEKETFNFLSKILSSMQAGSLELEN